MIDYLAVSCCSPFTISLGPCPACGEAHTLTLSRIGRFAFRCGRLDMTGRVEGFEATRRAFELTQAADAALHVQARRAPGGRTGLASSKRIAPDRGER